MNNKFIRERLDGDPTKISNYELIKTSTILNHDYKDGNVEITCSYLNAAKSLYNALMKQNKPIGVMAIIRTNSLVIPFLFNCRHTIELAIKVALEDNSIIYDNEHNLATLFSKLKITKKVNNDYVLLINVLDFIDTKGMWLRYDKDLKSKKEYIEKPLFVNPTEIISVTEKLTNFLLNEL